MPRPHRDLGAGLTYHVTARGNDGQPIFVTAADRHRFLDMLRAEVVARRWEGWAYCLMGNHVHLCVGTPDGDLDQGLRNVLGRYSRAFNRTHLRSGHLFGGRYWSSTIQDDTYLLAVVRYIARNPVEAGLVRLPEQWVWGSYAAVIGARSDDPVVPRTRVLALLHRRPIHARELLRSFVAYDDDVALCGPASERRSLSAIYAISDPVRATTTALALGRGVTDIAHAAGVSRAVAGRWARRAVAASP